jgi:hypothetical protein
VGVAAPVTPPATPPAEEAGAATDGGPDRSAGEAGGPDRQVADRADDRPVALLPGEVTTGFHAKWRDVQASFVDDPADAVRAAEALLDDIVAAISAAITDRRLSSGETGADASTEDLRTALRGHREIVHRLLDI